MKILMVSIPSLHFFRWTSQLQDSGHEVYWFDISGMSDKVERINWVTQKTAWKLRWYYPGRTFIKSKLPIIYHWIQKINEKNTAKVFEDYLNEIRPDVVHSFALYLSCTPIISVMEKYADLKWIYSSWGSDLFYFQNQIKYLKDIKSVLPRVNYLFTDCQRDYKIAQQYGFTGAFLGVFPGGGGYDLDKLNQYLLPFDKRNAIVIKGFQGRSGRAISVLKAVEKLKDLLADFDIMIFGADTEVFNFVSQSTLFNWKNLQIKSRISQEELFDIMGKSLIYIGNSNSDGIPNTLLEAVCMEVFPIQSNPGGATVEIIQHGINGILIEHPENVNEIKELLLKVLNERHLIEKGIIYNTQTLKPSLEYHIIKNKVIERYDSIKG